MRYKMKERRNQVLDYLLGKESEFDDDIVAALQNELSSESRFCNEQSAIASRCLSTRETYFGVYEENQYIADFDAVLDELHRETLAHSRRELTEMLGKLVEKFGAFHASLFLFSADKKSLRAVISRNVDDVETAIDDPGIVPHVALHRRGYFSNDIWRDEICKNATNDDSTTSSQIAVPMITFDDDLVGVVRLDSREKNAYNVADLEELQAAVGVLIPHVILAFPVLDSDYSLERRIWHPELHGYDLTKVFNRLCHALARSIHPDYANCSVWYTDRDKERLFAYATTGSDVEYKYEKTLDFESFMGSVAHFDPGEIDIIDPIRDDRFIRKDKASRLGMRRILASPIHKLDCCESTGISVLAVYLTDESLDSDELHDAIAYATYVLGKIATWFEAQRRSFVQARLHHLLYEKPKSSESDFEVLLGILKEVFDADGASIFARHCDDRKLYCVATTGLNTSEQQCESNAVVVGNFQPIYYDLDDDHGYTVFLANNWDEVIRINSFLDSFEKGLPDSLPDPQIKYSENFAPQHDHERRRMLGKRVSYCPDIEGTRKETLGVIRILRRPESKLFTACDERLLDTITNVCRKQFFDWRRTTSIARSGSTRPTSTVNVSGKGQNTQATQLAWTRIKRAIPFMRSTRTLIDELLHNLYSCYSEYKIKQTRLLVRHSSLGDEVDSFLTHAYYAEPDRHMSLPDQPISFNQLPFRRFAEVDAGNYAVHAISGYSRSLEKFGIWMPIRVWADHNFIEGILAVESNREVEWSKDHLLPMFDAGRRLSAIWGVTDPRGTAKRVVVPEVDTWDWKTVGDSYCAYLDHSFDIESEIVWHGTPEFNRLLNSTRSHENSDFNSFGLLRLNDSSFVIPLRIGPTVVGYLHCVQKTHRLPLRQFLGKSFGLWANLSFVRWNSSDFKFNSEYDPNRMIEYWQGTFLWEASTQSSCKPRRDLSLFTPDLSVQGAC